VLGDLALRSQAAKEASRLFLSDLTKLDHIWSSDCPMAIEELEHHRLPLDAVETASPHVLDLEAK